MTNTYIHTHVFKSLVRSIPVQQNMWVFRDVLCQFAEVHSCALTWEQHKIEKKNIKKINVNEIDE